jgi:hypothetical protein
MIDKPRERRELCSERHYLMSPFRGEHVIDIDYNIRTSDITLYCNLACKYTPSA